MSNRIDGDFYVNGTLVANNLALSANSVGDAQVNAGANIGAAKLQHRFRSVFNQVQGSAAAAERRPVFRAETTGTVTGVTVGSVVANIGGATITVDVLKNGTTILSAAVTLTSSQAAYSGTLAGTITSAGLVAADVLEVNVTVSVGGGTLGKGLFVMIEVDEDAN